MIGNKYNGYGPDGRRLYYKGGDGGAGAAAEQEAKRQARIKAATDTINGIFDSKPVKTGKGVATSFDPTATYYDSEGNPFTAPMVDRPTGRTYMEDDGDGRQRLQQEYASMPDMDAINKMIGSGKLFTGVDTITPESRTKLYDDQKTAVFDINKRDIDRQYGDAEKQVRFGLARNGLMGGSEDIDANAKLQDKNNEGLIKAAGIADQAGADLKMADERTRQGLLTMAQSGIDTGDAQQMALRGLDATTQTAAANRSGATIGDLFSNLGKAYVNNQTTAGVRSGLTGTQGYGVSSPQQTYAGT